jgi:two-component system cell cycle response regulator
MTSVHLSDGHSPAPEQTALDLHSEFGLASLIRPRGASLVDALEAHLPGSREHAEATGSYAFATAVELGHDRSHSELVREAAKLHDVGRVYVPRDVLAKDPDSLSEEERAQFDHQYEAAHGLARGAGIPEQVCGWILRTRERFDGHGPEGLTADGVPVESRIIRAACACDLLLTASADQRPGASIDERRQAAIDGLREAAGGELDPRVVEAFAALLERAAGVRA